MDNPQPNPSPEGSLARRTVRDAIFIEIEDIGETIRPPMTAEEIAAMKRFWERQGRKPPPPYDKL